MSEAYTKSDLVKELAQTARISRRRADLILETLALIAYRQARQSFAVPGICRLDVVHRKARQVRNPQTGDLLTIAEHDALRVRPVKRARDAVAPAPRALVQIVSSEPAATTPASLVATTTAPLPVVSTDAPAAAEVPAMAAPAQPAAAVPTPVAAPVGVSAPAASQASGAAPATTTSPALAAAPAAPSEPAPDDGPLISFRCKACNQEIEATLEMIGTPNDCPSCGETILVPYMSEPGTIWYRERTPAGAIPVPDATTMAQMKSRTIRIELPDDG